MTREELIAVLEKAEEPSAELDTEIAIAVGWKVEALTPTRLCWHEPPDPITGNSGWWAPRYTSSLDAALTLVPEGWRWSLDLTQRPHYRDCGRADLYAPGNGIEPPDVGDVYAATPAIALCIAALKARA